MAVGALTEEIAENLEEAAEVTRRISALPIGYLFAGIGVGATVGFYVGYRYSKKKLRAEILAEAEQEIETIREFYRQKLIAAQAQEKPMVEEIIEERGYRPYGTQEPAETPRRPQEEVAQERLLPHFEEPAPEARPLKAPVPITPTENEPIRRPTGTWNYPYEQSRRSFNAPYIIHKDEFDHSENGYSKVVYTYFAGDDVMVDEDNKPLLHGDEIVGQNNLRFGHGTDDENVVYVRNDKLELEMEICRVPQSFEAEVLGLEPNESD